MRYSRSTLQHAFLVLVLSVFATTVFAQNTILSGMVSDPQGNAKLIRGAATESGR